MKRLPSGKRRYATRETGDTETAWALVRKPRNVRCTRREILTGSRAEILSVLVGVPELNRPVQVHVPFVEASRDSLSNHTFQQIPFTHPKVEGRLQSMTEKWLTLPDDVRRAA